MQKFDNYEFLSEKEKQKNKAEDDFDKHDWESEVASLGKFQKQNLFLSPFQWRNENGEKTHWKKRFE